MKNITIPAECKNVIPDKWLSGILKKEAYKVIVDECFIKALEDKKSNDYILMASLRAKQVFMYAKVQPSHLEHIKALQKQGFYLVDTNILFEREISLHKKIQRSDGIRLAVPEDEDQVVKVAATSFKYTRFHLDSAFSSITANIIKAEWARNYFKDKRGDLMVVALEGKEIIGFAQIIRSKEDSLIIDLIAVDSGYRGRGVAGDMISYAESLCKNAKKIIVGTQLANSPSIACYEKNGFRIFGADYVFHCHNL